LGNNASVLFHSNLFHQIVTWYITEKFPRLWQDS